MIHASERIFLFCPSQQKEMTIPEVADVDAMTATQLRAVVRQ
jgi:hypothetical protein